MVAAVLLAAGVLGSRASLPVLALLCAGIASVVLARHPNLGLLAIIATALLVPFELGTGREVSLNLSALLVPATFALWFLMTVRHRDVHLPQSGTSKPLLLFTLASLLSLVVGTAYWDPAVPRPSNFLIVQLGQWGIFVLSSLAFWLIAALVREEVWLRRLTLVFLVIAGVVAAMRVLPGFQPFTERIATYAVNRAPFWMLLAATASGQLLFNRALSARWRLFLLATMAIVLFYAFVLERKTLSNLAGVATVFGVLAWLRWPRYRWLYIAVALAAVVAFSPSIFDFAGGEDEWEESGGSRLALSGRVVELTLRNPITGLGPAAYRPYGRVVPLAYLGAFYDNLGLSSHNNYVDLFSHAGLLGLGLFAWFAAEVFRLAVRLRSRYRDGFSAGYVNAMLAAWAGALVLMVFADWILPFVYNIGFLGFQASVLVWLFLGGLVALEQMASIHKEESQAAHV